VESLTLAIHIASGLDISLLRISHKFLNNSFNFSENGKGAAVGLSNEAAES